MLEWTLAVALLAGSGSDRPNFMVKFGAVLFRVPLDPAKCVVEGRWWSIDHGVPAPPELLPVLVNMSYFPLVSRLPGIVVPARTGSNSSMVQVARQSTLYVKHPLRFFVSRVKNL